MRIIKFAFIYFILIFGAKEMMARGEMARAHIGFHLEDPNQTASPDNFPHTIDGKKVYFKLQAFISRLDIAWIYPFPSLDDGTYGISFGLGQEGMRSLSNVSKDNLQAYILPVFHGNKIGRRTYAHLLIDAPVDGRVITVWSGIKKDELQMLKKIFRVYKVKRKFWKKKKK